MGEFVTAVAAPVLLMIGVLYCFAILVGSVALAAFVYWLRDLWKKR